MKAPFFHPRPDGAEVTGWIASPLRGEAPELFDAILTSVLAETIYSFGDRNRPYHFRLRRPNGKYFIHVLDGIHTPTARG